MSNECTQLGLESRKQAGWPRGAQLLAEGRGAAGEAVKGTGIAMMPWTCQGVASGQGQGAWALITVVLGLQRGAEKAAPTLEQRQNVMKKVPPPVCSTGLQRVK